MVQRCGRLAVELGHAYFGLEFYGECYLGDTPDFSQAKRVREADGCDKFCQYDTGGPKGMVVYKVHHLPAALKPCGKLHLSLSFLFIILPPLLFLLS